MLDLSARITVSYAGRDVVCKVPEGIEDVAMFIDAVESVLAAVYPYKGIRFEIKEKEEGC